jgi:hypothetical protein
MNTDLSSHLPCYDLANPMRIDLLKRDRAWRIEHSSCNWVISKRSMYDPATRCIEHLEPSSRLMTELHAIGQPWVCSRKNIDGEYITVDGEDCIRLRLMRKEIQTGETNCLKSSPTSGRQRAPSVGNRKQILTFTSQTSTSTNALSAVSSEGVMNSENLGRDQ